MLNGKNISLKEALDISIARIKDNYGNNWIITDEIGMDCRKIQVVDRQIYEKYEHVIEPDRHNYAEICICVNGSFALQIENRLVDMDEGIVGVILPGILHNELPGKGSSYSAIWIVIGPDVTTLHFSGKDKEKPFFTIGGSSLKTEYEYMRIINGIRDEVKNKYAYRYEAIKSCVLQLFIAIFRKITDPGAETADGNRWKESIINDVKNYIRDNYSKHIRLTDVSQAVYISPNYLNNMFKSATGKTIMQYQEDFRMDMAKQLLRDSGHSINHIASRLGYYDQYHFSKVFKKTTGYSPVQYRKMIYRGS